MQHVWEIVRQEFFCVHEYTQLVRFIKTNGAVCVREQCERCGESIKEIPKKGINVDLLPAWDEGLRQEWYADQEVRRSELYQQRNDEIEKEQQEKNDLWWRQYHEYLRSPHWRTMRLKVFERDGGICQACLKNEATQVHHLSYVLYEQIGRSAAFELVSVCFPCHAAIHPQLASIQRDEGAISSTSISLHRQQQIANNH